jgi:pimeloyl-ACP methyl ester carboxylesterase
VKSDVVLVPGLWNPSGVLWLLASRLRRSGYMPHLFSYRSRASYEANIERLARFVRETLDGRAAHFVGHSLGGVLVLDTLNRHSDIRVASALLIGSPARGSLAGRLLGRERLGRWMMGGAAQRWEAHDARWTRAAPLGVLAGSVPVGMGRMLGVGLPGVNDGVVCFEETAVEGMAARKLLPQPHSWMPISPSVGRLTEAFLRTGRFE